MNVLCWLGLHRWRMVARIIPAWDGKIRPGNICLMEPARIEEKKCSRCGVIHTP